MARDATVMLNELRCFAQEDASGGSEPYIWPALVLVDNTTLATAENVALVAPSLANSRLQLASNMRGGDRADIPPAVGMLRFRLEDGLPLQQLILVVSLLEEDELPDRAVDAGYQAYVAELRRELGANIFALALANDADRQVLITQITARVQGAVRRAIENALTASQKARVFLGLLNLDDSVDTAVTTIETIQDRDLTLEFRHRSDGEIDQSYQINGVLRVRQVPVEVCVAEAQAVRDAERGVAAVESMIESTQQELRSAPPALKPFLVAEIRRLKQTELPAAFAALDAARAALVACRRRAQVSLPDNRPPPVLTRG